MADWALLICQVVSRDKLLEAAVGTRDSEESKYQHQRLAHPDAV